MAGVMGDEDVDQRRHLFFGHGGPACLHRLADQRLGAKANHVAQMAQVKQGPLPGRQHGIGRPQKVGGVIGQGAV